MCHPAGAGRFGPSAPALAGTLPTVVNHPAGHLTGLYVGVGRCVVASDRPDWFGSLGRSGVAGAGFSAGGWRRVVRRLTSRRRRPTNPHLGKAEIPLIES